VGVAAFTGKRALITGSSSGIGLATARALVARGARVAVVDLAEPPIDLSPAAALQGDVGDPATWAAAAEMIRGELGGLDYAFVNAGVASREVDVTAIDDAEYRRVMGVNGDGVFYGVRTAAREIAAGGGPGAIVATSSLAGLVAFSPDPLYTMTKHAVIGLVRALATPLAERRVTINAVCPGLVDTPILTPEMRGSIERERFPLMDPDAIVAAVLDLFTGTETGGAWVCQPGRPPTRYAYRGVPGPVGHELPPDNLSGV
jgi:NAD(P)-dependent dehydrogenase (short-subunit alcohol dehydrogenase family)